MKQGTSEWLSWRRKHIGASDQTHLHWSAPWSIGWGALWDIKMGHAPEQFQEYQMAKGLHLEKEAILAYSLHKEEEFSPAIIESQEYPYLSASLDARSDSGKIAEIKYTGRLDHEAAFDGEIPHKYIPQLCHQLFVCGLDRMDYVSFDGKKIAVVEYQRDETLVQEVMAAAHRFHVFIAEGVRPTGEFPSPRFDTRIPVITEEAAIHEAEWNYSLREQLERTEAALEASNAKLLALCDMPRAKVGKLTIVTSQRKGSIDYTQVDALKGMDLERFRKPSVTVRSIRRS